MSAPPWSREKNPLDFLAQADGTEAAAGERKAAEEAIAALKTAQSKTEEPTMPKLDKAELVSANRHLAQPRAGGAVGTGTLPTTPKAHQEWEAIRERLQSGLTTS